MADASGGVLMSLALRKSDGYYGLCLTSMHLLPLVQRLK